MDALGLLRLQLDWGADEALDAAPRDRLRLPVVAPVHPQFEPTPTLQAAAPASGPARALALAAACHSVADLRAALADFTDCPLQATAIHLVFAEGAPLSGPPASGLMIVGDVPGEAEDRTGRPFSGPGGALLDRMLASIGLDRATVLLTHAVPWRPPGNRKPTDHERALCLPFLHRHIALVRPRRLLLHGQFATASLLPEAGTFRRLRGRWHEAAIPGLPAIPALPSTTPDHLMANPAAKREAWADLIALRRALDSDAAQPGPAHPVTAP